MPKRTIFSWLRAIPSVVLILLGAVVSVSLVAVLATSLSEEQTNDVSTSSNREAALPEPDRKIQEEGPLADGERISLEEAKFRSPYDLPVPPTTEQTKSRAGVWIDPTDQIAFVWTSDLRFYASPTRQSAEEAAKEWHTKVREQADEGWAMTTIRGQTALALNGSGDLIPSSITWVERGLILQFVSPQHDLDLISSFASEIVFED